MTMLLLLIACGGRATADSSRAAMSDAAANGGAQAAPDECFGGAAWAGCGGEAGERSLEEYAPLHTACRLSVRVNRRGAPVSIDCHIR